MNTRAIVAFTAMALASLTVQAAENSEWIQLFNGKNLNGWHVKIRQYDLDDNFGQTFRVDKGVMKVNYDKYEKFEDKFGHIFYEKPFSHYILRAEYRFTGEQVPGGPGWAFRNSGLMLHCQDPKTMAKDQKFPVSIEVQLLGGKGEGERTTANLCTPGTHVVMEEKLVKRHCISSKSKTYHGDQWVTVEVEVQGDQIVRHKVNGEVVLEYKDPQFDEKDADAKKLGARSGQKLKGGYISLQSESHPVEFRKVELKDLSKK